MMTKGETGVLIVGAGAAGSILSLELARHGVAARCVDRLPGPQVTSRAITLHARTAEMIERVDRRLIERIANRGIRNVGYDLHFLEDSGAIRHVPMGMDFTRLNSRYPYMIIHRQSETEDMIRDYARAEFGVEPEWNTRCTAVEIGDGEVIATLTHAGGDEERVACRYLIACDGANSAVRSAIGLGQSGGTVTGMVLQNLDAVLNDFPDVDDHVHYCAGTNHFLMVARLPGGIYRLLLSDRGEAASQDRTPIERFTELLRRYYPGVSVGEVVWHSKWEHAVRLADSYRKGNVILVGDCAHVHPTTGGQGMNCCMQDAFNLGWKLAMVEKGLARPELLDTYEAERRPIAEQVLWAAGALQDLFMGHGRDIGERSRKAQDADWMAQIVGRVSGISYTYADGAPAGEALPGPAIGDRAPDATLISGNSLYDLTRHTRFTLLGLPGRSGDDPSAALGEMAAQFKESLEPYYLTSTESLARQYGEHDAARLFLIRPDGYIGWRGFAGDTSGLAAYFRGLLRAA